MIKNKIILLIILVLMVATFTSGCSDKVEDKAQINTPENMVDNKLDTDAPEDIVDDDDEEEGEKVYAGYELGEEWPTELMDGIPQPPGRITRVATPLDMRHIKMEEVKKKDAYNFLDDLKALGFIVDPQEMIRDTYLLYIGDHEDGRRITYRWEADDKALEMIYELKP